MNKKNDYDTDLVFERDSYVAEFSATVLDCQETEHTERTLYAIILDLTGFFPEGGGQESDTGSIDDVRVVDVQNEDGKIIHYVEEAIDVGKKVVCSVDFEKRFVRMQHHSAEHLLCGLIHNAYGYENVGFHLNDECVTFDVDGPLSLEQIAEIELKANEVIYEDVPIIISLPSSEELGTMEYRSKLEMTDNVRIVTIVGYDSCACCAPHVKSTGEIGVIKIVDAFPHRGGMRFTMIAGRRAYEDYVMLDISNRKIMSLVSAKRGDTAELTERLSEKCQALQTENISLKKKITEYSIQKIDLDIKERKEGDVTPFLFFSEVLDAVQMRDIVNDCVKKLSCLVAGFIGNDVEGYKYIIASGGQADRINLKELAALMNDKINSKGGGSDKMIQGSVQCSKKNINDFFSTLEV